MVVTGTSGDEELVIPNLRVTKGLAVEGGSDFVNNGYVPIGQKGKPNGVATLEDNGKVPVSQSPMVSLNYLGTWDASTNTPTLLNGLITGQTAKKGEYYSVRVPGTFNNVDYKYGDRIVFDGTTNTWYKQANYDSFDACHPVGSTYLQYVNTADPNELFPSSTWVECGNTLCQSSLIDGTAYVVTSTVWLRQN